MKKQNLLLTAVATLTLFAMPTQVHAEEHNELSRFAFEAMNAHNDKAETRAKQKEQIKQTTDKVLNETTKASKSIFGKIADFFGSSNDEIVKSEAVPVDVSGLDINFVSGNSATVDLGASTLDPNNWEYSHVEYSDLDHLNRAGRATAYLEKQNWGPSEGRKGQTWQPAGWNNQELRMGKKGKKRVQDRGHIIAYTLTFNLDDSGNIEKGREGSFNNPKNLTTQSSYSNRGPFQTQEEIVRDGIKSGKKVIYEVTPLYGEYDLMPRAYQMQAVSTDGTINFNKMVYNVQPGVEFNYETGKPAVNNDMIVAK